jgi:hypothetical protein
MCSCAAPNACLTQPALSGALAWIGRWFEEKYCIATGTVPTDLSEHGDDKSHVLNNFAGTEFAPRQRATRHPTMTATVNALIVEIYIG